MNSSNRPPRIQRPHHGNAIQHGQQLVKGSGNDLIIPGVDLGEDEIE